MVMKKRIGLLLAAVLTAACVHPLFAEELISDVVQEEALTGGEAFEEEEPETIPQVGNSEEELALVSAADGKTIENAIPASYNTTYTKTWSKSNYKDPSYYRFTVTNRGVVQIHATQPEKIGEENLMNYQPLRLYLYTNAGQYIWIHNTTYATGTQGKLLTYNVGVGPGTYCLNIQPAFEITSGTYTSQMALNFIQNYGTEDEQTEIEENDTEAHANALTPGKWMDGWYGTAEPPYNDYDYFSFGVTGGSTYRIQMLGFTNLNSTSCMIDLRQPGSSEYKYISPGFVLSPETAEKSYYDFTPAYSGTAYLRLENYYREPLYYSVRVDKVGGATDPVTSLAKPVITGYYNSVKGADIRWKKVEGAKSYQIWRKRAAEGTILVDLIPVPESDPDVIQYFDPYVKDGCWGRVYNYYIVALRDGIKSPKSDEVVLQRLAPMRIISTPYYSYGSYGTATVLWQCTVSENKALGYELQYASSTADLYGQKGTFKKMTLKGRNNVTCAVTNLARGHNWYFRVRCYVNYTHSVTGKTTKTWSQYSDVVQVYAS